MLLHNFESLHMFAVITRSSKMLLYFLKLADFVTWPVNICIACFTSLSLVVKYSLLALLPVVYVHFHFSVLGHYRAIWCIVVRCLFGRVGKCVQLPCICAVKFSHLSMMQISCLLALFLFMCVSYSAINVLFIVAVVKCNGKVLSAAVEK
jgi:hypothetical protein